jgi:hypothetical protein
MKMAINSIKQRGAVSLFIVVFVALLITVVSIGFVGIMVQDQQQASATDLSQSAYDSAQAGIEDAKRALLLYQTICNGGGDCSAAQAKIDSKTSPACNASVETLDDIKAIMLPNGEVKIQTGGENTLDQAYTCVKIKLDTTDYLGTLSANDFDIIPLSSVGPFNTIQIQWFSSTDISSDKNFAVDLQSDGTTPLLAQNSWPSNRPSIMEVQLIQFGSNGFNLNDLETINNNDTVFLYPSTVGVSPLSFINDSHKTPTGKPQPVQCSSSLIGGGYACTISLTLPDPIGGGSRTAFLRIGAIYNNASFRVTLLNSSTPVEFNAVQPEIDSTGRANDLFRRVQARVRLTDVNFPYPKAAVDITGNLCKNFIITDSEGDYVNSCTP